MASNWRTRQILELSTENLQALILNEIPAISIADFATCAESENFTHAVLNMEAKDYEFGRPGKYIGNPLTHYRNKPKREYFQQVRIAEQERRNVTNKSFDPLARFIQLINKHTDFSIAIAEEPEYGPFFAGIIRIISGGSDLHVDYAPTFAKGTLSIGEVRTQLAWNYYASSPSKGGETTIYNRLYKFTGLDRVYRPYDGELLEGCEFITFKPIIGSVVIFNTANPHLVLPSAEGEQDQRIATGSFIGLMERRNLVVWS